MKVPATVVAANTKTDIAFDIGVLPFDCSQNRMQPGDRHMIAAVAVYGSYRIATVRKNQSKSKPAPAPPSLATRANGRSARDKTGKTGKTDRGCAQHQFS